MEEEPVSSEHQPAPAEENDPGTSAGGGRSWWTSEQHADPKQTHSSAPSRWDFSGIAFPDLGSGEGLVAPPDPALLPGGLSVGVCDVASWRQKVNLRRVRESAREQRREELQSRRMQEWSREVCLRPFLTWSSFCASSLSDSLCLSGSAVQKLGGVSGAPGEARGGASGPTGSPVERRGHALT